MQSLPLRAGLVELRDIPPNLTEVLLDVLNQKMIDHERCGFQSPSRILAGGLDRQLGIAHTAQRFSGLLHRLTNITKDASKGMACRVRDRRQTGGIAVIPAPQFVRSSRDANSFGRPEGYELADVAQNVHYRPDAFGRDPVDELRRKVFDLGDDFIGERLQLNRRRCSLRRLATRHDGPRERDAGPPEPADPRTKTGRPPPRLRA